MSKRAPRIGGRWVAYKGEWGSSTPPSCSRCEEHAVLVPSHPTMYLCVKHIRFRQMREAARRCGKAVPSWEELEHMATLLDGMKCPHCTRTMNWRASDGHSTVMCLQHYRSGRMGLICHRCNVMHGQLPGDVFCDLKDGQKWCPGCKKILSVESFCRDKSKVNGHRPRCRSCSSLDYKAWSPNRVRGRAERTRE